MTRLQIWSCVFESFMMRKVGKVSAAMPTAFNYVCLKVALSRVAIERLIGAASKLVGHFRHSVVATEHLKKRQVQMDISQKKLIQHCATCWNSTFHVLERLIEMRWPVSAVLSDEQVTKRSDRYLDLKSEQWVLAEELVKALRPFDVATTYMCYEENTTISSTLPIIHGLVESMKKSSEDCPNVVHFKHDVTSEIK